MSRCAPSSSSTQFDSYLYNDQIGTSAKADSTASAAISSSSPWAAPSPNARETRVETQDISPFPLFDFALKKTQRNVQATPVSPNNSTQGETVKPKELNKAQLMSIDNAGFSTAKDLAKWDDLVQGYPPEQRESIAKALNRPIAVAKMLEKKGPLADAAHAYLDANPALKTAIDIAQQDDAKADGRLTKRDLRTFAHKMEKARDNAAELVQDFQEKNPNADAQSLHMVKTSALLLANEPLTRAADPNKATNQANQEKVTEFTGVKDLKAIAEGNPSLSPMLKQAAKTWSHEGLFGILEHGDVSGKKLARIGHDSLMYGKDIQTWIKDKSPANGTEFADTLSYAATLGAASHTDISQLDEDIFKHPEQYTGAAKASVLIRLQQTMEQLMAGRTIRDTKETEEDLSNKIEQLQGDLEVQHYLKQQTPKEKQAILAADPELNQAVKDHFYSELASGKALDKALDKLPKEATADDLQARIDDFSVQLQQGREVGLNVPPIEHILKGQPGLENKLTQLAQKTQLSASENPTANGSNHVGIETSGFIDTSETKSGRNPFSAYSLLHKSVLMAGDSMTERVGGKAAVGIGGRIAAAVAGRVAAAVAGEAAGLATANAVGAASGPVGWAVAGAISLGMGIGELVNHFSKQAQQRRERRDFDNTVNPMLEQFNLKKPK